ncbi:MAG TPA: exodeoxyribonuclease V subunit alpha [Proteobacteria bacterium]|nr:exodeoxyribonuclease V subunit alpha [Pseudomonadota bacterium]
MACEEIARLEALVTPGPFDYIDIHFARLVCRRAGDESCWPLYLAALLAGHVVNRRRQVCLPLRALPSDLAAWLGLAEDVETDVVRASPTADEAFLAPEFFYDVTRFAEAERPGDDLAPGLEWPPDWENFLRAHPAVAGPEEAFSRRQLLVLDDDGRLYLQRYYEAEQRLAGLIRQRLAVAPRPLTPEPFFRENLAPRFLGPDDSLQAAAVCAGLRNRFTLISGGPGCGKTAVLAAIAALVAAGDPGARMALCAPTGLAQARLRQALLAELEAFVCPLELRERLSLLPATTIHRLLGYRPGAGYLYHRDHRLPFDLLIVDEASMVPLALMAALFAALPDECAVILSGDRYQLASVEAGAVFAELCSAAGANCFSPAFLADFRTLTQTTRPGLPATREHCLQDHLVELKKSHRFLPGGEIDRLQRALLAAAEDQGFAELCRSHSAGEIALCRLPPGNAAAESARRRLAELTVLLAGREVPLAAFAELDELSLAFAFLESFRVLAPLRRGPCGVDNLNRLLPAVFGLRPQGLYYQGQALLMVNNAPQLGLFNGDVGLVRPDAAGRLKVWFKRTDGDFAVFSPRRLPAHENAFALTVHKAQGSGYNRVVLFWPEHDTPFLTREMMYTAVTRAASKLEIWMPGKDRAALIAGLERARCRRVERPGGLRHSLGF